MWVMWALADKQNKTEQNSRGGRWPPISIGGGKEMSICECHRKALQVPVSNPLSVGWGVVLFRVGGWQKYLLHCDQASCDYGMEISPPLQISTHSCPHPVFVPLTHFLLPCLWSARFPTVISMLLWRSVLYVWLLDLFHAMEFLKHQGCFHMTVRNIGPGPRNVFCLHAKWVRDSLTSSRRMFCAEVLNTA